MAGKKLFMKIVSPTGTHFDGEILHASFPGVLGEFAVFPGHAPIVSVLKKGIVKYTSHDDWKATYNIAGGFMEVDGDWITVCVE